MSNLFSAISQNSQQETSQESSKQWFSMTLALLFLPLGSQSCSYSHSYPQPQNAFSGVSPFQYNLETSGIQQSSYSKIIYFSLLLEVALFTNIKKKHCKPIRLPKSFLHPITLIFHPFICTRNRPSEKDFSH